ncbi:MAG: D-2-hydroxyacid dehydrogenase [Treponema sp.]|nr:D-2-hydroxyacid dehydrogenase [Candidatus Treponema equifaecale]
MKLTVLDGHALNPGDLSWDCIKALVDDFTVYERSPQELVSERIGDSDCVLLNKINITEEIIKKCPKLRYIGVLATGYNVVDTKACREAGITVTNIPSYSTDAVAQHVFAFILNISNQVQIHSESVHAGDWIKNPDFCYWKNPLTELAGKTIGIFGFGNIGRQVAKIAHAFGMNVLVHVHSEKSFTGGEKSVSAEELFSQSDFISLHAPLTPETKEVINSNSISLMKPSAVIINTARGGLVEEKALRDALNEKKIAAYCGDVVLTEPMSSDCPLLNAPNCFITPHIAWAPHETRQRLMDIAVGNFKAFLDGKPVNVVN